jgi:signal recognition particle subunit SRP54
MKSGKLPEGFPQMPGGMPGFPGMGMPGMGLPGMGMPGMPGMAGAARATPTMRTLSAAERNAKKNQRKRERDARKKGKKK